MLFVSAQLQRPLALSSFWKEAPEDFMCWAKAQQVKRNSHATLFDRTATQIGAGSRLGGESNKICKSYTWKVQHMPLLLTLPIHRAANISRSLAELSAILRHKDEDIAPQSAAFCGVRSEQPITGRQAEEIKDRKSIRGARALARGQVSTEETNMTRYNRHVPPFPQRRGPALN